MYNWQPIDKYYRKQIEEYAEIPFTQTLYSDLFDKHASELIMINTKLSKSEIWNGISMHPDKTSGGSLRINNNMVDMLSSLFMGIVTCVEKQEELNPDDINTIKYTIDMFGKMGVEEVQVKLSSVIQRFIQNINNILSEFFHIASSTEGMSYMDTIKSVYFAGVLLGNALVWASTQDGLETKPSDNIFYGYFHYLQTTFENLPSDAGASMA